MGHTVAHPILTEGASIAGRITEHDRARDLAARLEQRLTAVAGAADNLLDTVDLVDCPDGTIAPKVRRRCGLLYEALHPEADR